MLVVASLVSYVGTAFWFFERFFFFIFNDFFLFSLTWDPMGTKNSKHFSHKSQPKVFKLSLNFLPYSLHKASFGILKILSLMNFVFRKFQIHNFMLWRNKKPQLSGRRVLVERNGVKFGIRLEYLRYMGYLWPYTVQCHLGVNLCSCNYSDNTIFNVLLLLHLWFFYSQTFYSCSFWQSV